MAPRRSPKTSPKASPEQSPRASPRAKANKDTSADEAAKAIRAQISDRKGALAIADLAGDGVRSTVTDWISTQSVELDQALGTPGIPCGRITEIFGKNHSGKSTLLAHLCAEVQRRGGLAYVIDQEASIDRAYWAAIGVQVDKLQLLQPAEPTIEAGVEALEQLVDQLLQYPHLLAVVGWDTVAAAPSAKELEESVKNAQPGYAAKSIRAMCRRMVARLAESRIAQVVLNQTYTAIGKMFGDPETPYGGEALGLYSSVRFQMRAAGKLPDDVPGSLSRVRIVKSKVSAASGRQCVLALAHGRGFDNCYSIYQMLSDRKLVAHGGGGYCTVRLSAEEELRWRGGWLGLVRLCAEKPEVYARLVDAYRAITSPAAAEVPSAQV